MMNDIVDNYSFFKENERMNYCFEAGNKSEIYNFINNFVNAHSDILTVDNLNEFSTHILPPSAFDDGKFRSEEEYHMVKTSTNNIKMAKIQELSRERGMVA